MKKKILIFACVFILCIAAALPALAGTPKVVLDGKTLTFDVQPTVENGRTLVPLRAIFEALGATVQWDEATQTVTAAKGDVTVKLTVGGKAFKNDAEVTLDVPAKVVNGRTLVPLRFVGEAFGTKVDWDAATEAVALTSAAEPAEPSKPAEPATPAKPVAATPFEEYLNSLPFDATVIADKTKEAQFIITGEHAGNYAVTIDKGKITWVKGNAKAPAITVTTSEQVWLEVYNRKVDPTQALMAGKFKADGDLPFFIEIKNAFIKKAE